MIEAAYVFAMVALIPFFSWQQREEGRNVVGALLTGVFLILWLFAGLFPASWDLTTQLTACFAAWLFASLLWSNSRQSASDLYTFLSCLTVFLVARRLSTLVLVGMLFLPGVIFAGLSLWNVRRKIETNDDIKKKWPIFGNSNHVGAFLLVPLFCGLWLSFNVSPWLFVPTVAIGIALGFNQCRGAHAGTLTGLYYVACLQTPWMLALLPFIVVALYLVYRFRSDRRSISRRLFILAGTVILIKRSPLAGYGLRTFRREFPSILPELTTNRWVKAMMQGTIEENTSHRVHNDHLELVFELGIIGYALFLAIFGSLEWAANPILSGAIVAFAVHGLFFFPLREAHTAFPFFALAGGMAATTAAPVLVPPLIAFTAIFIVGRVMYVIAVKGYGLTCYDQSQKFAIAPNPQDKDGKAKLKKRQQWLDRAIACDPYNNIYLTEGYYYNVFERPEQAFQYASRCMENYDGGKVRWGVCDQYARALVRLGGFGVAKMALKYALHLCPTFTQSANLIDQLDRMEKPAEGV